MTRRIKPILAALLLLPFSTPAAWAAGGAHIIDDASVETAGQCHLESWLASNPKGPDALNLNPGCTFTALPRLELGATFQHQGGAAPDTSFGPALKLTLRPVETGLGIALSGNAVWSDRNDRLETASVLLPLSLQPADGLQINLNAGWLYNRAGKQETAGFIGAQLDQDLGHDLALMLEGFARGGGRPGAQMGLRWTPGGGVIDIDLLTGWRTDGSTARTHTIGLTWRI